MNRVIEENIEHMDWYDVSKSLILPESFIEKNAEKLNWYWISRNQKLSEFFIEKFADKVDWKEISARQKLSTRFLMDHAKDVDWVQVSVAQKLSEAFMHEYADKLDWDLLIKHQVLSEKFITEEIKRIDMDTIGLYQPLSNEFRTKHKIQNIEKGIYKKTNAKKAEVERQKLYECHEDYFVAYKGIRADNYSKFNFQFQYFAGNAYFCHADYTPNEFSFGLYAATEEQATKYCDEKIIRVKIRYENLARLLDKGQKIRCNAFTVLEEIKPKKYIY